MKATSNYTANSYQWLMSHKDRTKIIENYEVAIMKVKDVVCEKNDITLSELMSKEQTRTLTQSRFLCFYILVDIMGIPNQYITNHFDMTSGHICYGRKSIADQITRYDDLNYFITECFIKC